jgi:hypothetical protein
LETSFMVSIPGFSYLGEESGFSQLEILPFPILSDFFIAFRFPFFLRKVKSFPGNRVIRHYLKNPSSGTLIRGGLAISSQRREK